MKKILFSIIIAFISFSCSNITDPGQNIATVNGKFLSDWGIHPLEWSSTIEMSYMDSVYVDSLEKMKVDIGGYFKFENIELKNSNIANFKLYVFAYQWKILYVDTNIVLNAGENNITLYQDTVAQLDYYY